MLFAAHLAAGLRLSSLVPRALLVALIAGLVVSIWWPLRSGTTPSVRASDVGLETALTAALSEREGLRAAEDAVHYLEAPDARPWSQALGPVPALASASVEGEDDDEPEDIYYLEVRPMADGSPLAIQHLNNLTRTPHASEKMLARQGMSVLFAVEVFGQIQSLLLVDVSGDERDTSAMSHAGDRWRHSVTNLQKTGRTGGIGMRLFALDPPPETVRATPSDGGFEIVLGGGDKEVTATLDLDSAALVWPEGTKPRATYQPRFFAQKSLVPWLVDTIRDLSWVGPRKVAILEQFVFRWRDNIKQAAFAVGLVSGEGNLAEELGTDPSLGAVVAEPIERVGDWPPPDVVPGIGKPAPGEGQWAPAPMPWLRKLASKDAPPAFLKTAVRMDPRRPYDNVVLIAMDMRQLDLKMVAGTVTPESSFGNRGTGLIPREPAVLDRLVAAFNGGFKTAHGAYGMVTDRTTIMPAMPYAATLTIDDDQRIRMGSWYNSMTPPKEVASLRQNLPPLIKDGVLNPTGKRKWGGTASDLDGIHTTRSGVAYRGTHTLIFAWCRSCSADSLGQAMIAAGCGFGMHLDMNPTHTGFSYYRTNSKDLDDEGMLTRFDVAPGSPAMSFKEARYLGRDVKDFFYLTLRATLAERLPAPPEGFSAWTSAGAPRGSDGLFPLAAVSKGSAPGTGLVVIDAARLGTKMRRGDREPDPTQGLGQETRAPAVSLEDPALLVDLGLVDLATPSGFFADGRIFAPVIAGQLALIRSKNGELRMVGPDEAGGQTPRSLSHLRGGESLIRGGEAVEVGGGGAGVVHGLGVDGEGRVVYGAMVGVEALRGALMAVGARDAMLLPESPVKGGARVAFVRVEDGGLVELDPFSGREQPVSAERGGVTHLYFERTPTAARIEALALEDVVLSEAESRRQRKLQTQINSLREELRQIENARYRAFQEMKKAREGQKE